MALDRLYPGWDGLEAGAAYACARILTPRAAGVRATWQEWDWAGARYSEHADLAADRAVIVEGSGAITSETAPLASIRVWLDAPGELRRHRALTRDGETYRPHWDRWARQEERHVERNRPREHATHVFEIA